MARRSISRPVFPKRILVITYGGHGDILLTTPLIAALKQAYPKAMIDVFVQKGRTGMLAGNPDVCQVLESDSRHGAGSYIRFFARRSLRYGLSVSARVSDRQVLFARAAGRRAISMIPRHGHNRWWKGPLLSGWADHDGNHVAIGLLQLADVLGIERVYSCRVPYDPNSQARLRTCIPFSWESDPFAVIHLTPRNPYKEWDVGHWQTTIRYLQGQGYQIVLIGGGDDYERRYAAEVAGDIPGTIHNLIGETSFADAACMLKRCRVYVGPDTAMTHLAAACGTPTVALYGADIPHYLPYHDRIVDHPYTAVSSNERAGAHVRVVLGTCECVEGKPACVRKPRERSVCMGNLSTTSVIQVLESLHSAGADAYHAG